MTRYLVSKSRAHPLKWAPGRRPANGPSFARAAAVSAGYMWPMFFRVLNCLFI